MITWIFLSEIMKKRLCKRAWEIIVKMIWLTRPSCPSFVFRVNIYKSEKRERIRSVILLVLSCISTSSRFLITVADPDHQIRGRGWGEGGHPDPEISGGGGRSPKNFFRPFGRHFGRKIRGGRPSPGSAAESNQKRELRISQLTSRQVRNRDQKIVSISGSRQG